ncbi:helix-turn-helix domain-containing protein [Jiangella alba]|uniref:AraC-type DNA-binding protein n=1 Tax=Jiangella alba TaxID=561176 RepID=A0A1H5JUM1_9ACTN|nr:helix-turn-helix domain-containing protein [Jiangella alba]SEE56259.1 AraC-type DNA-binding protein [Jiangella alba]
MTRPAQSVATRFEDFGLTAFTFRRERKFGQPHDLRGSPLHTHLEIELHFVECGAISLDCGGREDRLHRGELQAFWGGIPHRDVDPEPPLTVYHVAQLPIVNVLTWEGSAEILDRLLAGEVVRSAPELLDRTADQLAFARWTSHLATGDHRLRAAVEMEIQARLLRLLVDTASMTRSAAPHTGTATADLVARAIRYVTRHFVEEITIKDVAQAVDKHHDHLMASFRRICGVTLWEYVTRLRLNEAQRLLATTDLPILAVCHRSGFSSTSRMYEAFHRYHGQTPASYRRQQHVGPGVTAGL